MTEARLNPLGTPVTGPPDGLQDRIRRSLAREKTPSRFPTRNRVQVALVVVPLLTAIVTLIASEIVYHRFSAGLEVDPAQSTRMAWTLALLAGMSFASTAIAVGRGSQGFGLGAVCLAMTSALVVPVYSALTLVGPLHRYDAPAPGIMISPWGTRCALIEVAVGLAVIASLSIALRRAVPVENRLRSAVIGAAAGAWAGLAVFVFCPSGDPQHLIAGHIVPMIGLLLFGAFATPRWLRP